MDPDKAELEGKSLHKRGKQILRTPFNAMGALLGNKSSRSSAAAGFLTRLPDPSWIDIEMIGYWLKKCDTKHGGKCRRPFGLDPLGLGQAQWLIDVRRKCLTSAKPKHRYACLSYVWGGTSTLKTGKDNLESLLEENSLANHWNEIPKTIRNTVNLVDQLGIPYLWVDCLCIVQDDTESKHQQIQAMSGIYANAYVTVIAANGWDADHGLRGIQGVTEPRHLSTFLKSDFRESLQPYSSIWYSRGTFQEMIFSPRKIMFQYQLAIWECNNGSWHESSLCTIPTALEASYFKPTTSPWQSQIEISCWPDVQKYISIVHDYARRKLTYGDDALHAITSLLSVMSTSFSGGFITGLPEMFFDEALLWQPGEPMQRRRSSEGQLSIPSWSWVGWEGEILKLSWKHLFCHLHPNKKVLGSNLGYSSDLGITALPGGWDPYNPARQVIPAVTWFYGQTLLERFPIKISGHTYINHMTDNSLPLPPGWTLSGSSYLFDDQKNTISAYPLPVSSSQVSRTIPARYLFCRTTRGYLKSPKGTRYLVLPSSITLQDTNRDSVHSIGNLNLNLVQLTFQEPKEQIEFELAVISAGKLIGTAQVVKSTPVNLHYVTLPYGFGWAGSNFELPLGLISSTESTEPVQQLIGVYYVLWIEWEDGIAYRKGLGRVFKEAWDRMETEEIDLVLG